ncbi:MAG: mechanosensitive ion channel [Desulfobacterales bacterium]|jgi:small-conductance mechanosensitive channel
MIELMQKYFPFRTGFPSRMHARQAAVLALTLLLILTLVTATQAKEEGDIVTNAQVSPEQIAQTAESEVQNHRAELANLNGQLRQLETAQKELQVQIKDYDTQNTAHAQLLLMDRVQTEDLENAIRENWLAAKALSETVERFQRNLDSHSIDFEKNLERIELASQKILDIRQSDLSGPRKRQLVEPMQQLFDTLEDKKRVEERILKIYDNLLDQAKSALTAKTDIGNRLTAALEKLKKTSITQRMDPYRDLSTGVLLEDLRELKDRILAVFKFDSWKKLWDQIQMGGLIPWMFFLAGLAAIFALRDRVRRYLNQIENRYDGTNCHYRRLCLLLLRRSLLYVGLTLLFLIYSSVQFSLFDIGLGRVLFYVFFVLLVVRWGIDFIKHGFKGPQNALRSFVSLHLRRFMRFFRIAIITVLVLSLVTGVDSLLAWTAKNIVMTVLLVLAAVFWRRMKPVVARQAREGLRPPNPGWTALVRRTTYLVFGGSLMLNLAGYSTLAVQWFRAWAESVVLVFWGWISYKILQEFHRDFRDKLAAAQQQSPTTIGGHWRWSLIQLAWVVWLFTLTAALVRIWDPTGVLWSWLERFFYLTFTVGSLNFSVKGMVLGIFIVFITHLFLRVGRALLKEKILDKRPIERGLKDSILTIASYLGWALGLVLALGFLGVNTTSLAVIFGALSIGIGFGLQNIFNNFISGLILLFERPIQVGDYVEVGGLWAEVKKINVRSTVVQTFDNASVIIPNSEFISQQVTNWSFRDKRMRRNLEVGVAYGSDVDLVEKTLLEIALATPRVLKYPRPDVLFVDHADSALIFRLRIWVDVDDYWAVASRIRFDIDRRFRELAIEIAFPQRDLHIRTLPKQMEKAACPDSS